MMPDITLRPATEEDSDFVFHVKKAALGPYIQQTWGWDEDFQRKYHENDFEPAKTQIIVLNDCAVGWLLIAESDNEFELQEIYVTPEHQSRGIGSHLIKSLLSAAEEREKIVRLQVLKVNVRARSLYERLGFSLTGETETHYVMRTIGPRSR